MNFILILSAILILPLIPAFLLYKFLPSRTNVTGPFKGLNLKLTGAFAGYFLLVITAIAIFFPLLKNEQMQTINQLQAKIDELEKRASGSQRWEMKGNVISSAPKLTKVFFDETGSRFFETGEFSMEFDCMLKNGKPDLPKAVCIFNNNDGYKVLNISREFNSGDIKQFAISFNDSARVIKIDSAINIQSKEEQRLEIEKALISKARQGKIDIFTYDPEKTSKLLRIDKLRLQQIKKP